MFCALCLFPLSFCTDLRTQTPLISTSHDFAWRTNPTLHDADTPAGIPGTPHLKQRTISTFKTRIHGSMKVCANGHQTALAAKCVLLVLSCCTWYRRFHCFLSTVTVFRYERRVSCDTDGEGERNEERRANREEGAGSWELGAGGWGLGKE